MKEQNNWLSFAEEDIKMANSAFKERIFNQTCFHSQQGAEKMLKGFLKARGINIPKTHFLVELLNMCVKIDKDFKDLQSDCSVLDDYYIPTRYPDAIPGALSEGLPHEKDAKQAMSILLRASEFIKNKMDN